MVSVALLRTFPFEGRTPLFRFLHCHPDLFYFTIFVRSRSSPDYACLTIDPFHRDLCPRSSVRRRVARPERTVYKGKERGNQRVHRCERTIRRTKECGNCGEEWRDRCRRGGGADSQLSGGEELASQRRQDLSKRRQPEIIYGPLVKLPGILRRRPRLRCLEEKFLDVMYNTATTQRY